MSSNTITISCYNNQENNKHLILKLKSKRVIWDTNVIDNEHLNKWKCNCCCNKQINSILNHSKKK